MAHPFGVIAFAIAATLCASASASAQSTAQKSGKVVMEDGSPLPEPVIIEMSCGSGVAGPVARSDSKGGFTLGRGSGLDRAARLPGDSAVRTTDVAGCSFKARLAGYQSSTLRVVDNQANDVGTITLSRPAGVEGTLHSITSVKAPKNAQTALREATEAIGKKKPDQARLGLEKAVRIYPEYAQAWLELGRVHQAAGNLTQARKALGEAIKADPKYVPPYMQLADLFYRQKDWKGAADASATLIKLDPFFFPAAHVLNAISNLRMGNTEAAEESARAAIKLDTGHAYPEAKQVLGLALGARGQYKEAVEHLQAYLRLVPNSPDAEAVRKQIADFEQALRRQPAGPQGPGIQ